MSFKKSFTLIEIILALLVSSMIGLYVLKEIQHNDFLRAVVKLQDTVKYIVDKGLISSNGYANARGGDCSDNYDFVGLNSLRFISCGDLSSKFEQDVDNSLYFTGEGLMENYGKCLVKLTNKSSERRKFKIIIDCYSVDNNNKKNKALIEDALNFTFSKEYSQFNPKIERNVIPTSLATPTEDDGVIEVILEI